MKRLLAIAALSLVSLMTYAQKPADYVNVFIGSSNFGACNPGAIVPNGMVSVVPYNVTKNSKNSADTDTGWHSTPYVEENNFLTGFTHVNLSGVGCPDLGSIILMPTTGEVEPDKDLYGSTYSNESGYPGYYSISLDKYDVKAEVTATQRSGLSRYTFPKGKSNIILNLGLGLTNETGSYAKIVSDTEIEGHKMMGAFCYNNTDAVFPVYFVVKFSKPSTDKGYFKFHQKLVGAKHNWSSTSGKYKVYKKYLKEMAGDNIGTFFSFDTKEDEQIEVQVGVSYVSIENARLNLETEQDGFDFDKISKKAYDVWNSDLSRVLVEGGTKDDKTVFYSALYHTLIHPNVIQDVNGEYPAMESNDILKVGYDGNRYTVFSLWDTYRNLHPLLSLLYPERQADMVKTIVAMYDESGWMPKWELYGKETHTMNGDPATPVIVDTYLRGVTDFDIDKAYEGMYKTATTPQDENFIRKQNDDYMAKGYVPFKTDYDNSVSEALELYIADWNLGQLAKELGKEDDYKRFNAISYGYKNYFSSEFDLFVPKKADDTFIDNFDPMMGENFEPSHGFHEGTSWNYSFFVPHDIKGLIKLHKGSKNFTANLDECFSEGCYDPSNEPNIAYGYLYNYIKGKEWKTQETIARLRDDYTNVPGGIPGNDDTGTLSAWIIYSMMGIYPTCPGDMDYAITSPLFDKVTIKLNQDVYPGKEIVITANREDKSNVYIKDYSWNGKKQNRYFFNHNELVKGGNLNFNLKSTK